MLKEKIIQFRKKYETRLDIFFFICGFILDAFLVNHPDELFALFQQIAYILTIISLLHFEILYRLFKFKPNSYLTKFWPYRNFILHFLLGTLLNIYSILYIKSASLFSSLFFLVTMIFALLANELHITKKAAIGFKIALHAICLFSFLSILFPMLCGFVGNFPFGLAAATTILFYFIQQQILYKKIKNRLLLYKTVLIPGISVVLLFSVFYFLRWIPPLPLSIKDQGVYHMIEKNDGKYILSYEKGERTFWQTTNSKFFSQPGDKIYFYAQIYSPASISDDVSVHWFQKDKKDNWISTDKVPLKVQGGRKEGYRGFTYKSNYTAGQWKIVVETSSGIEISRLYFEIQTVEKNLNRNFIVIQK